MSKDVVNHPSHYASQAVSGHEPIELCEMFPFALGNAIKYMIRAGHKENTPEEQDLKKARWYLLRHLENGISAHSVFHGQDDQYYGIIRLFRAKNAFIHCLFEDVDGLPTVYPSSVAKTIRLIDEALIEPAFELTCPVPDASSLRTSGDEMTEEKINQLIFDFECDTRTKLRKSVGHCVAIYLWKNTRKGIPTGKINARFIYRDAKKERTLGLWPTMSLSEARRLADTTDRKRTAIGEHIRRLK